MFCLWAGVKRSKQTGMARHQGQRNKSGVNICNITSQTAKRRFGIHSHRFPMSSEEITFDLRSFCTFDSSADGSTVKERT